MNRKELIELMLFIVIEIIGLIPAGIAFLVKKTSENPIADPAVNLTKHYMIRGVMIFLAAVPLYFLLPGKRTFVIIGIVALQLVNSALFRKGK